MRKKFVYSKSQFEGAYFWLGKGYSLDDNRDWRDYWSAFTFEGDMGIWWVLHDRLDTVRQNLRYG